MQDFSIRIVRERPVYWNDYGTLFDDEVEFLPHATPGAYLRWSWRAPYSVAVLPCLPNGDVVLIRSFRHAARGFIVEAPKGFGSDSKTPLETARAELREEAGLVSDSIIDLGVVHTDPAFAHHPMHLFVAHDCIQGSAAHEESEVIAETVTISREKVAGLLASGELSDAVTLLLLYRVSHREVGDGQSSCPPVLE